MDNTNLLDPDTIIKNACKSLHRVGIEQHRLQNINNTQHSFAKISAQDIYAPFAVPKFPTSMMDGYATRNKDLPNTLSLSKQIQAGKQLEKFTCPPKNCVEIATGAIVPPELDTVIPVELAEIKGKKITLPKVQAYKWIRKTGSEVQKNQQLIATGNVIDARSLALLTSLGITRIRTYKQLKVGVLATGNELVNAGNYLDKGCIFDANRPQLLSLLTKHNCQAIDLGIAQDKAADLKSKFLAAKSMCDVLITIGGASVGKHDLLKQTLTKLGKVHAHKLAIKPGKPFMWGTLDDMPVFGLPGNPASVFVTFLILVLPVIWHLQGMQPLPQLPWIKATTTTSLVSEKGRTDYQRGSLQQQTDGSWQVQALALQRSAALSSLAHANCLIRIPKNVSKVAANKQLDVLPLFLLN